MMPNDEILRVNKRLDELERRIEELEKTVSVERGVEAYEAVTPKDNITRLAEKVKISEEDIKKLFDLEESSLTLVKVFGKDDKERTKNLTIVVLLGYKYLFGVGEVLSSEIRRNAAENKIPVNNFATYLNEITPSFIRRKGQPRSTKTTYRLTTLGEVEARGILKNLAGNQ